MTDLSGLKVLVVEDEGSIALLIEDMLIDLGCERGRMPEETQTEGGERRAAKGFHPVFSQSNHFARALVGTRTKSLRR